MKTNTKSTSLFASFILAVALFALAGIAGIFFANVSPKAEDAGSGNVARTYYYAELRKSPLAQKFYNVLEEMNAAGDFKNGIAEYDLIGKGALTESEVSGYLDSSALIPVAFGAARDAFYMDHPELFYLDVYKIYISAGEQNGKTVAFINTGDAHNYYLDGIADSEAEVDAMIARYDAAVEALVSGAKAAGSDPVKRIEYVNTEIANNTAYDYGARENGKGGVDYDLTVSTAYGALVNKKAICGGFSRAFKVVMDKLDIPCVLVHGSARSTDDGGYEPHAWNAVMVDGLWYAVDVTYGSGAKNPKKYQLLGDNNFSVNHVEDGVISTSGFELKYPALRPLDYGVTVDANDFELKDSGTIGGKQLGYYGYDESDPNKKELRLGVNFKGKNAKQLLEDGLYLAFNEYGDNWFGMTEYFKFMELNAEVPEWNIDSYSVFDVNGEAITFAVLDVAPDTVYSSIIDYKEKLLYSDELMNSEHVIAKSITYRNEAYGKIDHAPYVQKIVPYGGGIIKKLDTVAVTLEYSEKLVKAEGKENEKVGIAVTGEHDNIQPYIKVENIAFDGDRKVTFDFTPSKKFIHNSERYYFTPTNLVGEKSKLAPEAGSLAFAQKQVVCPKVFNDGRLYMKVFGEPLFVGGEDLSETKFADKNGQPIVGNQRSQMMLVVNYPDAQESKKMEDALYEKGEGKGNLDEGDIKASATYEINLHLCGVVRQVPSGSYMQVGFGLPEGYEGMEGVTFTVYHYKRDSAGKIIEVEEVPCVVTEYGIIATVKSFSPFMICAVDSSKVKTVGKNVYAGVNGIGGTICGEVKTTEITTVKESETVKYALTAEEGYTVGAVTLNGNDITAKVKGSELELGYDDLDAKGNVVDVTFVAKRVQDYREKNNIVIKRPNIIVDKNDMIVAELPNDESIAPVAPSDNGNTGLIVAIVIIAVLLAVGAAVATVLIMRKNKAKSTTSVTVTTSRGSKTVTNGSTKSTTKKKSPTQTRKRK